MSDQPKSVAGTLFRGADGNLYFVPDSALEPFRVFDAQEPRIESFLTGEGEGADAESTELDAVYTTISVGAEPQAEEMVAMQKPLIFVAYLQDKE